MIEVFCVSAVVLAVVLYGQARQAAREIRRNRQTGDVPPPAVLPAKRSF